MADVLSIRRVRKLAIHLGADASRKVRAMLDRQNLSGHTATQRDFPAGAIGYLGSGALPAEGNICFFTGLPINGPDVADPADADAAARLFPAYDGAFTGIFWDVQREVLVVATDCLGMQPLYMRHTDDELTLVSETKALNADPDLAAWGAFISVGHPIGERSLLSGLRRVPPASVLTYDCARRQLSLRRYWEWPEPSNAWRHYDFLEALERDSHAYAALSSPGTLLLSGGFDSRLLLFLLQRAHIPVDAMIVAHEDEHDDADGRLAQAVAVLAGIPSRKVYPPSDFFSSSAYLDYLRASDVGYPSLDLFIAKVASQIGSATVWDGLVPGFAFMPLHQPEGGFDAYVREEIRGPDSAIWRAAKTLFKPEIVDAMSEGFSEDLRAETARLPQGMSGLARFVIENRSRNRASANPLKVYANRSDAFVPGLSKDFMTHAVAIPFREKRHGKYYRDLFARLDKRSLTLPFLSGGQLMKGAGIGPAFYRELLRIEAGKFQARHPRLFSGTPRTTTQRSTFLGKHLLGEDDRWLDPQARERLKTVNADNYVAWKLLFHWKAWQWVHAGRLESLLGGHANPDVQSRARGTGC
jgi:hypothetical protein